MTTTKAIIIVGCVQPPSIFEKKKKLERAPWPGNFFFFFFKGYVGLVVRRLSRSMWIGS